MAHLGPGLESSFLRVQEGGLGESDGSKAAASGLCGDGVPDIDLLFAIEVAGNRSVAAQLDNAAQQRKIDGTVLLPSLCKGRIWCAYETQAWGLGLGAAFAVATWWACKMCLLELERDQETE